MSVYDESDPIGHYDIDKIKLELLKENPQIRCNINPLLKDILARLDALEAK